jgi:hypothetical protein
MTTGSPEGAAFDDPYCGPPKIDSSRPHPARRYNYWLGGKDNFEVDRKSGDDIAARFPTVRLAAIENWRFMQRAVAYLAQQGFRQFLDIGCGIPLSPTVHEIVQGIAADARVVYVDNDPMVMAHARALLTGDDESTIAYVEQDLRDVDAILADPALRKTFDLRKPVVLLLVAVLHFLTDKDDPYALVARLIEALPPGSVVVLSHVDENNAQFNADAGSEHGSFRARTADEVLEFIPGLELLDPGLVSIVDWRRGINPEPTASAKETAVYGVAARVVRSAELSDAKIKTAVRRYQAGEGVEPLARSMGLGSRTMRTILVDAGEVIRSSGKPWPHTRGRAETTQDAQALYETGNAVHGIARKLDIPYATIRLLLAERGVQFRHRSAGPHREA